MAAPSEARYKTPSYSVNDDLTIVRGAHQYGIGGVAFWKSLTQANVRSPGQFTFDGSITGLPLADFLTGRLQSLIQATPNTLDMQQWALGPYAQDTWKMSTKTTLNYGVRWSLASRSESATAGSTTSARIAEQRQDDATPTRRRDSCIRVMRASSTAMGWRTTGGSFPREWAFAGSCR